jgi:hypothetical protein
MALYKYKYIERDKDRPFVLARPLRGFTIESKVEENGKTVAVGTLEFRDVTEPLGSDNRNVLIDWKATSIAGADPSANWDVRGSRPSNLDKISSVVNAALRAFVTRALNDPKVCKK